MVRVVAPGTVVWVADVVVKDVVVHGPSQFLARNRDKSYLLVINHGCGQQTIWFYYRNGDFH